MQHEHRRKLLSRVEEKWLKDILLKPKLRIYIQIKHKYDSEPYVRANLSRSQNVFSSPPSGN